VRAFYPASGVDYIHDKVPGHVIHHSVSVSRPSNC